MRSRTARCGPHLLAGRRFELDTSGGAGADLARLVQFVVREGVRESGLVTTPVIAAQLAEAIVHAMLRLPHDVPRPPAMPAHGFAVVRRVEDYLVANAAQPVTLAQIAAIAGTGIRTLQTMFRRHRGVPSGTGSFSCRLVRSLSASVAINGNSSPTRRTNPRATGAR